MPDSVLREEIAQALHDVRISPDTYARNGLPPGKPQLDDYARADAVLRVVRDRLLSDEAGEVMLRNLCQSDAFEVTTHDLTAALRAALDAAGGTP